MRRARCHAEPMGPTPALRQSFRSHVGSAIGNPRTEHSLGNQAVLRRLSRTAPLVQRDPPSPDASKKPAAAAPASAPPGPAPSPTPDASKTDEVKLTIPWDEILKGNATLMSVLMPGLQPPAPGAASPAPAAPSGPTAGTSPAPPPAAPAAAPAGAAPAAPSRLSLKDFGNLSLGLRLGFPDLKTDTAPDAPPSALQQSIQTGEIINYSMTGKLPSAYQLDKGKLVGACWGLFSKYIAPDVAAKIAKGMSGKSAGGGLSYELDGVLLPDFSGAGVAFTLKFGGGKAPRPAAPAAAPGPVQPKLKVGSTSDPLEAEADRAADQVMRMSDPASADVLHRKCAACEEEDAKVNRKENAQAHDSGNAPPIVHQALSSPGQPLDAATRAFFEPRFGVDFSNVRVHSDSVAQQSAAAVNALAYATGPNIVLGAGASSGVNHLVAHELAHVAQQGGAKPRIESSATVGSRIQRQTGAYPDLNMPAFPCDRGAGIELCNTTKDSVNAPNFGDCMDASKEIIDSCKGDRNECLAQSKCALCACLGNKYCKCTGIV